MLTFGNPLKGLDRCPHCNVTSPLLGQEWIAVIAGEYFGRIYATYRCSHCNRLTVAEGNEALVRNGNFDNLSFANGIKNIYPAQKQVAVDLPSEAQRYLKQAVGTLFAPDASIVMSASAVDAMLKAKGYTVGSLYSRIDKAVEEHVLTEGMGHWAHRVRLGANAVRHADQELAAPTDHDAQKVLDFASALGDFLFVFTARVDEGIKAADGDHFA